MVHIFGKRLQVEIYTILKIFRNASYLDQETITWMMLELQDRHPLLDKFVRYYDNTWMPIFYEWNLTVFDEEKSRKATNNAIESYHSKLMKRMGDHPRIERFVTSVKGIANEILLKVDANVQREENRIPQGVKARDLIRDFETVLAHLPAKRSGLAD